MTVPVCRAPHSRDFAGGGAPRGELFAAVTVPGLAMPGEQTLPLFPPAAESSVSSVADGRTARVAGANHSWELDAMTTTLADLLRG